MTRWAKASRRAASSAPIATISVGIGDDKGNRIRAGASESGVFISGKHMTKRGLEIVPSFTFGGDDGNAKDVIYGGLMIRKWIRVSVPPRVER